ncbi:hypothetical protein, partial [Streptomyces thermogriseus]|uniref:hypothetical protein n=1 Tax=Streptomyces thermogriseus TaxID=75292 RepID=UPI0031F7DE3C
CLRRAIVMILPSPSIMGYGLSSQVDQSQGTRSPRRRLGHRGRHVLELQRRVTRPPARYERSRILPFTAMASMPDKP